MCSIPITIRMPFSGHATVSLDQLDTLVSHLGLFDAMQPSISISIFTVQAWILTRERVPDGPVLQAAYGVLDRYKISRTFFVNTDQNDCETKGQAEEAADEAVDSGYDIVVNDQTIAEELFNNNYGSQYNDVIYSRDANGTAGLNATGPSTEAPAVTSTLKKEWFSSSQAIRTIANLLSTSNLIYYFRFYVLHTHFHESQHKLARIKNIVWFSYLKNELSRFLPFTNLTKRSFDLAVAPGTRCGQLHAESLRKEEEKRRERNWHLPTVDVVYWKQRG